MGKEQSTGDELRDKGIKRAEDHANEKSKGWSEQAYTFLLEFIKGDGIDYFLAEDVREASIGAIPEPPSLRAWGGIITRASKAGIIYHVGYRKVKNRKAHCTPASLWKANLSL